MTNHRQTLGPYMSLTCFQYLRVGTEEVADRAPIVAAGRKRGTDVIDQLGLNGSTKDSATMREALNAALGVDGTRLCLVERIDSVAGGYEVHLKESACTSGQVADEPLCAFTLGVFIGAISAITGMRMRGHEIMCSACGAEECVYHIEPV